jgi:oligopeptide/dipeptide ABC transporter ATP-binding protein
MEKLAEVGLSSEAYNKYPHEFSGGQRQRIAILRAVITSPLVVVCDEPTSALDVSVRAQIINLLIDLQKKYNMSYMFISHDLGIVNYISDRIIVVYSGQIMEIITSDAMYTSYKHPYTDVLIKSMPSINVINDKKETPIKGEVTLSFEEIRGCPYKTRCFYARKDCDEVNMELIEIGKNHFTACPFFI